MSSIKRKISVLLSAAVAMLAFGALASSAQAFTIEDGATGNECGELTVEGNKVSGGCLIEGMQGEFTVLSGGVVFNTFDVTFDMRIDTQGNFYGINQIVQSHPGYPRQECVDYATGQKIPWAGSSATGLKMTMCLAPPPGYGGGTQTVTFKSNLEEAYGSGFFFRGMEQINSPSSGIAYADFDNLGSSYKEIFIVP